MAKGPRYAVKFRRRRLNKTNYYKRLKILKSRTPRMVIRKTNKFINSQIISYSRTGDKTAVSCSSKELSAFGWKFGLKNRPAAYLTGMLMAKKAAESKIPEVVVDIGSYTPTKGNKLFSFLKGAKDFGSVSFSVSDEIFPSEEFLSVVSGKNLAKEIKETSENIKKGVSKKAGAKK